jgi:hypothetical protein
MIKIPLAVIADSANVSQEGKLNILGIFQNIAAGTVPATHPLFSLIVTFQGERGDANNEHQIKIQMVSEEGEVMLNIAGNLRFNLPPSGEHSVSAHQIFQFANVTFKSFGTYDLNIFVNNEVRKTVSLSLMEVKQSTN